VTSAPTAAAIIWRSPFLRAAFIALFLSGIGVSSTTPQMTLFMVNELGSSVPVAGLYYLTNFAAPLAGYWLGNLSDRQDNRLVLYRICAVLGGVGWLAMALATQVWMPFVIAAVVLSISGGSMGLLFAAVRDELSWTGSPASDRVISAVRMAFTAGWIVGPVVGSWFGAVYGLRPLLLVTALLTAGQIVPLGFQRVSRYVSPPRTATLPAATTPTDTPRAGGIRQSTEIAASSQPGGRRGRRMTENATAAVRGAPSKAPLFAFVACCVLVMNGDTIKFAFLPLYMANDLGLSDTLRGAVIAIQPLLELALMPFFALLADRITPIRVVAIGAAFGVAANIAYATSEHVLGLFVGQILMSCLWAALAGLGVTVAQQLYPYGVGLASSVFMSSIMLSGGLGGAIGGLGTALVGVPHVFYVPAALGLVGTVGLVIIARRHRPDDAAFG
jgi:SET family sugar efflux transporter-like MFS transporter